MTAAITIHYKNSELTARCIDSLLADGWAPVLVWDNSADGGASCDALRARHAGDARVLFKPNAHNLGFGAGMNAALVELGRQDYQGAVLLLNNDARVLPGMRIAMQRVLSGASAPTLLAPRILQNGREHGWLFYQPWLSLVTRQAIPGSFCWLTGCCLLVQRANNSLPLFDESFFMYGEDLELSWRFRRQGGSLVLMEHIWVEHEGSASTGKASAAYEQFLVRSHWLLAERLASNVATKWLMRLLRLPVLLARACFRAMRYRSWVPLSALTRFSSPCSIRPKDQIARR